MSRARMLSGSAASLLLAGAALADPGLRVELVDLDQGAGSATVGVALSDIEMVDPAAAKERAASGQGHLHYRVDDGVVVATTVTRLSFHELRAGEHRIEVILVGNDHRPLGPRQVVGVTVRAPTTSR